MTGGDEAVGRPALLAEYPHLVSAIMAAVVVAVAVGGTLAISRARISARTNELVPSLFTQKWKGEAAPLALLQRSDVLPLYGSSELVVNMPNRATDFFAAYPTGFAVAPLGDRGYPLLNIAVGIGSLGRALQGKRIAISLSGAWFVGGGNTESFRAVVRNHYSELQAGDLLFFSGLPLDVRGHVADEILKYEWVTRDFPLLNPVLACLAKSCGYRQALPVFAPAWEARALVLRAEDAAHVAWDLRGPPQRVVRRAAQIDWSALEAKADTNWRAGSTSNTFGFENAAWAEVYGPQIAAQRGTMSDSGFLRSMRGAIRWDELDVLLETLRGLGARPLILNTPLKGMWWDSLGVSAAARRQFYQRFDSVTAKYGMPVLNFEDRDADRMFLSDGGSHLSGKGWVVYDQKLNAFYHGAIQ